MSRHRDDPAPRRATARSISSTRCGIRTAARTGGPSISTSCSAATIRFVCGASTASTTRSGISTSRRSARGVIRAAARSCWSACTSATAAGSGAPTRRASSSSTTRRSRTGCRRRCGASATIAVCRSSTRRRRSATRPGAIRAFASTSGRCSTTASCSKASSIRRPSTRSSRRADAPDIAGPASASRSVGCRATTRASIIRATRASSPRSPHRGMRVRVMGGASLSPSLHGEPNVELLPAGAVPSADVPVDARRVLLPHPSRVLRGVRPRRARGDAVRHCRSSPKSRGGYASWIRHGENGFLFDDPREAALQLDALSADPALRARVGAAAHATARTLFGEDLPERTRRALLPPPA